ncbi:Hypothetical_protein [Hexamita inflata]|uniref:Hypothetical_protein n=1 Tax=Hexamita inflata TaxID=28002 RepID=A0AA86PTI5_9EUKA|nr:Hypothetical protein HINF_LOCUS28855 [Hexamita inflata]
MSDKQLNPDSHFGKLLYSYYGTYNIDEIDQINEDDDEDYVAPPEPAKKRKKYQLTAKSMRRLYQRYQLINIQNPTQMSTIEQQVRGSFATALIVKRNLLKRIKMTDDAELKEFLQQQLQLVNERRQAITILSRFMDQTVANLSIEQLQLAYNKNDSEKLQLYFPKILNGNISPQGKILMGEVALASILIKQGKNIDILALDEEQKQILLKYLIKMI